MDNFEKISYVRYELPPTHGLEQSDPSLGACQDLSSE